MPHKTETEPAASALLEGYVAGYQFRDIGLLREALTHPSLSGRQNYQRLEFLGDRVLGLTVADFVFERFPGENEGRLNRRLSALVRGETIAQVVRRAGLAPLIHMTDGAEAEGTREQNNILADIGEALIGAIYLDGGLQAARDWITAQWDDLLESDIRPQKDAKTRLQEWAQARGQALPVYSIVSRSGPDHAPAFVVRAELAGHGSADADGASKRLAEQKAAAKLLTQLEGAP